MTAALVGMVALASVAIGMEVRDGSQEVQAQVGNLGRGGHGFAFAERERGPHDSRLRQVRGDAGPYTIRIQGVATDGVAPPPPTVAPVPTASTVSDPVIDTWGECPALIAEALGRAGCLVSWCESEWNPWATGPAGERGDFQIHPIHADSTYDRAGNVAAAVRISRGGTDWGPWTERIVLSTGRCSNGRIPPV